MTLREYIDGLQALIDENPKSADLPVVYSKDDEGNSFHLVSFEPSLREFADLTERCLDPVFEEDEGEPNAVVIN